MPLIPLHLENDWNFVHLTTVRCSSYPGEIASEMIAVDFAASQSIADQLMADFRQESALVSLIIKGCIEYSWAVGDEERQIAQAMVYNAFETYAIARGIPLEEAEDFCENHLADLVNMVQDALMQGDRSSDSP